MLARPVHPAATNTIAFNIPGGGLHLITVTSVTNITAPITIDGSTQPGYAGVPVIEITGVVQDLTAFSVNANGSTLKDLMLTNTNGGGLVDGATAIFFSSGGYLIGDYFNTDGSSVVGAYGAGLLFSSSTNNVIGGSAAATHNLFGGQTGIFIQDSSSNLIQGNYFGWKADGNSALSGLPGNGNGIEIFDVAGNAASNTISGNVITGFLAGIQLFQGGIKIRLQEIIWYRCQWLDRPQQRYRTLCLWCSK